MARANRQGGNGGMFHVTHRCHNREFLLKFRLDRDGYRAKLRKHLPDFEILLLDYCVTSNHVHLLLEAEERMQISGLMRRVAGEFARAYNRRKQRMNAFWEDNFHATLVEEGTYLWALSVLHRAKHRALRQRIRPFILSRHETELMQQDREIWVLQETPVPYGSKTSSEKAPEGLN